MVRCRRSVVPTVLVGMAGFLLSLNGCGGSQPVTPDATIPPYAHYIQHVVVIFQENRTPDNLFQDPTLISQGADIADKGKNSKGQNISFNAIDLAVGYDLDHGHPEFVKMYDDGKMDGADLIRVACLPGVKKCAPANPQFMYVNPEDVQPYFRLAENYVFGDRMFQTNQGPSFPAHQFIFSGTSAPTATSNLFVAENPVYRSGEGTNAGCIASAGTTVKLINAKGGESSAQYPCFEHPTLSDLLDSKEITWRYYTPSAGSIWTGPDAIKHICQPQLLTEGLSCTGTEWSNVIIPQSQVLTDIANKQLAHVTWVIPGGLQSDHALSTDGSGPSWVASIVNAIGNSDYWSNTAIFITWDDWGGWYDHVAPKTINSYEYGFRVPLIVVSPYAKAAYISHVTHDFGSILKFIEETYGLSSLGYADAPADDFSDCFDFNRTPMVFQTIPAPLLAEHFLNDHRPATDPDDD
jgi:phospholipase C